MNALARPRRAATNDLSAWHTLNRALTESIIAPSQQSDEVVLQPDRGFWGRVRAVGRMDGFHPEAAARPRQKGGFQSPPASTCQPAGASLLALKAAGYFARLLGSGPDRQADFPRLRRARAWAALLLTVMVEAGLPF